MRIFADIFEINLKHVRLCCLLCVMMNATTLEDDWASMFTLLYLIGYPDIYTSNQLPLLYSSGPSSTQDALEPAWPAAVAIFIDVYLPLPFIWVLHKCIVPEIDYISWCIFASLDPICRWGWSNTVCSISPS